METGRLAGRFEIPAHLRLRPEDALSVAARKIVGQHTVKMRANVQGTLHDLDPECLHDLRVAVRRLRSALRLLAEVMGRRRCDSLRAELGWIGRILGAVRDLDVFILNLQAQAARLAEARSVVELLVAELRRRREPAHDALAAALASHRFTALLGRLDALTASPAPRRPRGVGRRPVVEVAPALMQRAQKRVLKLGRTIRADSPAADLHRLRILFKRLRYTCEFFREAFCDPTSGTDGLADYIRTTVQFQDCLGEHQDAVVALARIQELARAMAQKGMLDPERFMDLGAILQVQRDIARTRRKRFTKLWRGFDRPSVRRRLAPLGADDAAAAGSA